MEHLLSRGQRASIRIRNYRARPDDDGNIATVDDCARLFAAAVKQQSSVPSATIDEIAALWIEHCRDGRVYSLCHGLLDQFYFGLLYQVLGPNVVIADFTVREDNGSVFLSTSKLEGYLLSWRSHVHLLEDDEKSQLSSRVYSMLYQAMLVLQHLSDFLGWSYENVPVKQAYPDDEEPLGNTQFACAILHQALFKAYIKTFDSEDSKHYDLDLAGNLPWLEKRMEREGWCPYTVEKLRSDGAVDGIVFGYSMGTLRSDMADHGSCTADVCYANNIAAPEPSSVQRSEHVFGPQHVNKGCDCWIVAAPLKEINAILEQGGIPILRIGTDDGYRLRLHARKADPENKLGKYIAMSHVWVDGLGSPYSNTITQCQLTRIADRLGKLEATESCGELSIWADTLCIPVDRQHSRLRQLAISSMNRVYKKAYAVMLMDADTLNMQAHPPVEELGMRLYLSAWSSRLWTYQESALNDRLLVMTADSVLDVDDYMEKSKDDDADTNKLQHDIVNYTREMITTIRGRRNIHSRRQTSLQVSSTAHIRNDDFDHVAQLLFNAILKRTSSRADDEAIVIATYLGLQLSSVLASAGEEKIVALLRAMPSIPTVLLFAESDRLSVAGFRWAPNSFTRAKGGDSYFGLDLDTEQIPSASAKTILQRPPLKLDSRSRGLWTFNSAIKLDKMFTFEFAGKSERTWTWMIFKLFDRLYWIDPAIAVSTSQFQERKESLRKELQHTSNGERELVILLPGPIPTDKLSRAVLVEILQEVDDAEHEGTLMVKYLMTLHLGNADTLPYVSDAIEKSVDEDDQDPRRFSAEWIEPRWWLVD